MATVQELREGSGRIDGAASSVTRRFRVWSADPLAAATDAGLPQTGEGHPSNDDLKVQTYSVTREPAISACVVDVNYGVSELIAGPSGNDDTTFDTANIVGRITSDVTTQIVDATVPMLRPERRRPVTTAAPDPDGPFQLAWRAERFPVRAVQTTRTIRTSFLLTPPQNLSQLFGAFDQVTTQVDRLHVIGGRPLLFSCRLINQATEKGESGLELWNAEYSWTTDPGVIVPDELPAGWTYHTGDSVGNEEIRLPALESPFRPGARFLKPPFADVLHGPLAIDDLSLTDPEFIARVRPETDLSGHLGLPGL